MRSLITAILILFLTIFLTNCTGSHEVRPVDLLIKFKTDTTINKNRDPIFYKFEYLWSSYGPAVTLSSDSSINLINTLQSLTSTDSIGEAFIKFDKEFGYLIYPFSLKWYIRADFKGKRNVLSYISFLPNYPIVKRTPTNINSSVLKFLSEFENDRSFRIAHIADTVRGYDYYNNDPYPKYKNIWDKERLDNYLDMYFDPEGAVNEVEQFWMDSPYLANLILRKDRFGMYGAALSFRKINDRWLLEKCTVSTDQYPPIFSVYQDLDGQNDLDDDVRLSSGKIEDNIDFYERSHTLNKKEVVEGGGD